VDSTTSGYHIRPAVSTIRGYVGVNMVVVVERTELARLIDAARPASISPAEWARRSGYTPQLIADFRNHGKNVTVDVLLKMLDAIGARLQVLPSSSTVELMDSEGARVVAELTRVLIKAQKDPQVRAFVIGAVRGAIAGAKATLSDEDASSVGS
jgi:hypothetical protein